MRLRCGPAWCASGGSARSPGILASPKSIVLPASLFPGLIERPLPNNLYGLFAEKYGIGIARASERLKAMALGASDAALLGVAPGTPALAIDRLALAIDGRKVEWRVSHCLTTHVHYASDLT